VFCIKGKAMSNNAMSNETDLDWLAQNVHEWAEDWTHVRKCPVRHEAKWMASLSPNAEYKDWRTKEQWLARRAELQNKPGWEDAPEWGCCMVQDKRGNWYFCSDTPIRKDSEWDDDSVRSSVLANGGVVIGDWRDTLEKRPEKTIVDICGEVTQENRHEQIFETFVSVEDAATAKQPAITQSKYTKTIHGVSVDVYDVLQAWGVTNPALQHLIKKALQCGQRGHKDNAQDLQDIIDSAIRAKELG